MSAFLFSFFIVSEQCFSRNAYRKMKGKSAEIIFQIYFIYQYFVKSN